MSQLFDRAVKIQVQDRLIEGLACEFRVDRSLNANPNTADLTIYNLSPENRAFLQEFQKPVVKIQAGYLGADPTDPDTSQPVQQATTSEPPLIFLGEMREVTNLREGTDWLTRISTGDGDEALRTPIAFSLGPGTSFENAVKRVVSDMGVGVGNAFTALSKGQFAEAGKQFVNGVVGSGLGGKELDKLLKSAGLEYSVQNGDLQVLPIGQPANNTAILLTTSTGLIGSPELGLDKNTKKQLVKCRSLINAKLFPGAKIRIQSDAINAFFRVTRVVYSGHTHAQEWYTDIEAGILE